MKIIFVAYVLALSIFAAGCSGGQSKNQGTTTQTTTGATGTVNTGTANNTGSTAGTAIKDPHAFTLEDLKQYNGQNGNPAYVAVNGLVYDVTNSKLWKNGVHKDCSNSTYAGADYSSLINSSPHGADIMKRLTVVGVLKK